jgi:hypothetical protein
MMLINSDVVVQVTGMHKYVPIASEEHSRYVTQSTVFAPVELRYELWLLTLLVRCSQLHQP